MSEQKTIYKRLQDIVADGAYIHADPDNKGFSQKTKDDVRTQINQLLDYVISQTDLRHIKVLYDEAKKKLLGKKLDDMRKENLERLKSE